VEHHSQHHLMVQQIIDLEQVVFFYHGKDIQLVLVQIDLYYLIVDLVDSIRGHLLVMDLIVVVDSKKMFFLLLF